jgi:hypothetical protein
MLKTLTSAAVLAATAVAGLAAPAYAADGAFDFNGFFSHRLDSRSYTTGRTGTHTVTKTTADCPGPGDNMRVRLVRNVTWGGDYNYPWKTWNCTDDDQSRSWISEWDTTFHFSVEKQDTDSTADYWYITGNVTYPHN